MRRCGPLWPPGDCARVTGNAEVIPINSTAPLLPSGRQSFQQLQVAVRLANTGVERHFYNHAVRFRATVTLRLTGTIKARVVRRPYDKASAVWTGRLPASPPTQPP